MRRSSRHPETAETPDERRDAEGTVSRALAALGASLRAVGDRVTDERGSTDEWRRVWLTRSKARWRRGDEVVECFRFDDAFVATVEYVDRGVTWQLTAGPAPLPCALAAVALYVEHGTTPQIDPDGRPFVAVGPDGPRQAFEESASEPVEYLYIDAFRTLEEVPDSVDVSRLRTVGDRLDPRPRRELRSD